MLNNVRLQYYIHKIHNNFFTYIKYSGYLGYKNQQDDCGGPGEVTDTCDNSESVDHGPHSVVDDEDNYQHKAGEIRSHDNLPVVVQPLHFHLSGFESHHDCHSLQKNFVAVEYPQCCIPGNGGADVNEVLVFHIHDL